jgi:hypothetical protein
MISFSLVREVGCHWLYIYCLGLWGSIQRATLQEQFSGHGMNESCLYTPKNKTPGADNWYSDEFLKNSSAADDIFI